MLSRISFFLFVGVFGFFLTACDSDLNSAKSIDLDENVQVETTKGAEIIYSDSAKVKAKLKAPILLHFKASKPYYEMPKGINVVFYDENLNPTSTVTSDYAIRREHEKTVELRKNVVATNIKGETFKSEELIWDENTKKFYSNQVVSINTGQATISGTSFWALEDFSYYEIKQGSGPIQFNADLDSTATATP
ncbi:LPS export ABC transporter periplasmic protein LptC [Pedobacter puniceum]|uniref:LPS export ABC transporter periplasmic protein LptC n=1 Tax=Pedobacter puniceum TaxID=2666136 RepID=A0A7K0FT29_9SPHI|nr:LPS export ABC transporter periplasmic protein LptC [Pedobacter puniceum]MRX48635.1 LPS export ABC transporter periplasmic protein LptC [Pedobacter puniceum]